MNTPRRIPGPLLQPAFTRFVDAGFHCVSVMGTPKMNRPSARIGYARVSTADQNLDAQMAGQSTSPICPEHLLVQ